MRTNVGVKMAFQFFKYKPDQGRISRGIAFWLLTGLAYFGCRTLYFFLHWEWAKENLLSEKMPVLDIPLNWALIISVAVFLVVTGFIMSRVVNRPKMGDLLVETETEMKKVTWPSWDDAFNSSLVVLVGVIFFMILLGFSDVILNQIFSKFIFGPSG